VYINGLLIMTDIRIKTNDSGHFEVYDADTFCACFVYPESASEFVLELIEQERFEENMIDKLMEVE
jgi:hypothetical protein